MGANNHLTVVPTNYHADDADAAEPVADGGSKRGVVSRTPHLTVIPENATEEGE